MGISISEFKKNSAIDEVRESLSALMDYDSDWNGDNGEDYLLEDAQENGFECNLDWFVEQVLCNLLDGDGTLINDIDKLEEIFEHILESYQRLNRYEQAEIGIHETDSSFILAIYYKHEV